MFNFYSAILYCKKNFQEGCIVTMMDFLQTYRQVAKDMDVMDA